MKFNTYFFSSEDQENLRSLITAVNKLIRAIAEPVISLGNSVENYNLWISVLHKYLLIFGLTLIFLLLFFIIILCILGESDKSSEPNKSSEPDKSSELDNISDTDSLFGFDGSSNLEKMKKLSKGLGFFGDDDNGDDDKDNNKKRKNDDSDNEDNNKKRKKDDNVNLKPSEVRDFIKKNKRKNNDDKDNNNKNKMWIKDKSVYESESRTINSLGNYTDYRRVAREEWSKFYTGGRSDYIRDKAGGSLYALDDRKLRDLFDKFITTKAKNPNLDLTWEKASQIYASSYDNKLLGNTINGSSYNQLMARIGYGYKLKPTRKYVNITRGLSLEQMEAYCKMCDHAEKGSDYRFNYIKSLNELIRIYKFFNEKNEK